MNDIISLSANILLGGIVTFFGIMVWARTNQPAWMLVVISVIVYYAKIVFKLLDAIGVIHFDQITLLGIPVVSFAFEAGPQVFILLAFIALLSQKDNY